LFCYFLRTSARPASRWLQQNCVSWRPEENSGQTVSQIFNKGEILKFIKTVSGVSSLMVLATVTAFGSHSHRNPNPTPNPTPAPTPAPAPSALAITSSGALPGGVASTSYTTSLTATGGTTPYNWSFKSCSGVCNAGLSLSPAGVFSGTPINSGTSTYSVGVIDATGQSASASLNLTIAAATPSSSSTANYFVSPSGSDSNPCTQTSPCATPNYVVNNKATGGDTVQVAAGTYDYGSSEVHFTKSGTAGNYITLSCATRGACKIQNSVTGNSTVVEIDSNYFTFDGFEVTNTSSAGNNLGIYVTSSFVNVTRNKIHHIEVDCSDIGGGGIHASKYSPTVHDLTIDSNLVYDIGWPDGGSPKCPSSTVQFDGILTETPGANIVMTNNIVYHVSGGWGIAAGSDSATNPAAPNLISNNLVFSNSNGGIIITNGGDYSTVTNNIILNNGVVAAQCGIHTIWAADNHILEANNDVNGNAGGDYCAAGTPIQNGNISVNPASGNTFINWNAGGSGDYHQKAGSPTVNNGTSSTGAPRNDFDGNPRPQGAAYDIGAYESPY
jgi:parallel beta-helix repeat protein